MRALGGREHGGDRGCWTVGARRGGPCLGRRRHLPATRSFADQLEGRILARWLRPSIVSHSGSEDGHSSRHIPAHIRSLWRLKSGGCSCLAWWLGAYILDVPLILAAFLTSFGL
ncbi:hypothetical protein ACQJBY_015595 [Aegilops geniculata]